MNLSLHGFYSSTKIMSLAAYEIAKQKDIPLWLIDTWHGKVVALVKQTTVDSQQFFHMAVSEYMKSYGYTIKDNKQADYHYESNFLAQNDILGELLRSPDTETIRNLLRASSFTNGPISIVLRSEMKNSTLLHLLEQHGLLEIKIGDDNKMVCTMSYKTAHFLMGSWLELYVWHEVIKAQFADDCRRDFRITNGQVQFGCDLAITYKTKLLIVECKTTYKPFSDTQLAKLDSMANLLGGNYVGKIFITNQNGEGATFRDFCEKARLRNIVVITKENLPAVATILEHASTTLPYLKI